MLLFPLFLHRVLVTHLFFSNMAISLFDLPAELLISIVSLLHVRDLLKFSTCSRFARSLGNSSLHTLKLDFYNPPCQRNFRLATGNVARLRCPSRATSPLRRLIASTHTQACRATSASFSSRFQLDEDIPDTISVLIQDAQEYENEVLVNLHSKLITCILARYHNIRRLDIAVWVLTVLMAKAIPELPGLRSLSIVIQETAYTRVTQREFAATQTAAWHALASSSAWTDGLRMLKINNADIIQPDLLTLLKHAPRCQELSMIKCHAVNTALWDFLGTNWEGRTTLRVLVVRQCGIILGKSALNAIGKMGSLQVKHIQHISVTFANNTVSRPP